MLLQSSDHRAPVWSPFYLSGTEEQMYDVTDAFRAAAEYGGGLSATKLLPFDTEMLRKAAALASNLTGGYELEGNARSYRAR